MKRRKGKTRKPAGRSQPVRLTIQRLETRQLLAGFASVAVPGAVETGAVDFIDSAEHINVKIVDSSCSSTATTGGDSGCHVDSGVIGPVNQATFFKATLAVGDGIGFNYRALSGVDNNVSMSEPATTEVVFGPQPALTLNPITIITEGPAFALDPNSAESSQSDPEVGVYFTEPNPATTGDQPGEVGATAQTASTTGPTRIPTLARVQAFALLSPSDLPGPQLPAFDANPLLNSTTTASAQVDSIFEDLDDELDFPSDEGGQPPIVVVSGLNVRAAETGSVEPIDFADPIITEPGLNQLSVPDLGVLPAVPLNVLEDVLQAIVVEVVEESNRQKMPVEKTPVNPDLSANDATNETEDEELVEGIYLVEGVILIAALPSSLVRHRDDESENSSSV